MVVACLFQVMFYTSNCIAIEGFGQALKYDLTCMLPDFTDTFSQAQTWVIHAQTPCTNFPWVIEGPQGVFMEGALAVVNILKLMGENN